jgi:hypothetical protein
MPRSCVCVHLRTADEPAASWPVPNMQRRLEHPEPEGGGDVAERPVRVHAHNARGVHPLQRLELALEPGPARAPSRDFRASTCPPARPASTRRSHSPHLGERVERAKGILDALRADGPHRALLRLRSTGGRVAARKCLFSMEGAVCGRLRRFAAHYRRGRPP